MDNKYVCPCGLTCCDCLFYKQEIYETAEDLREVIQNSQLDRFLDLIVKNKGWRGIANHLGQESSEIEQHFKSFERFSTFLEVLDGLINLQCKTTCREAGGCSIGGVTHSPYAVRNLTKNRDGGNSRVFSKLG